METKGTEKRMKRNQSNTVIDCPTSAVVMPSRSDIRLRWERLTFTVSPNGFQQCYGDGESCKPKVLLRNVSGSVDGGQLMAILGPSGAGKVRPLFNALSWNNCKTTLINALAGRIESVGVLEGRIQVNGRKVSITKYAG